MADKLMVLAVEDDPRVRQTIVETLRRDGYTPIACDAGKTALATLTRQRPDLLVLDLGLPDMDGLDVLREVRRVAGALPVLILTARDTVGDKVAGLDAGADDYLAKPFSPAELTARLRALLRRARRPADTTIAVGDLQIDLRSRRVTRAGKPVMLTPREFDLLACLVENRGQIVTRAMLAEHVWQYTSRATPIDNVIDVMIHRLREKLADGGESHLIQTVRGVGFSIPLPP